MTDSPTYTDPAGKSARKIVCQSCGTHRELEFDCVSCCCRWLKSMPRELMKFHAEIIAKVTSEAHLNEVREAMRKI